MTWGSSTPWSSELWFKGGFIHEITRKKFCSTLTMVILEVVGKFWHDELKRKLSSFSIPGCLMWKLKQKCPTRHTWKQMNHNNQICPGYSIPFVTPVSLVAIPMQERWTFAHDTVIISHSKTKRWVLVIYVILPV